MMDEVIYMNVFLNNTANYPVKGIINSVEYSLNSNQTQKINFEGESIKLTAVITDENRNSSFVSSKIKNTINKLFLNVSCTYVSDNISDGDTLSLHNRIYEFKDNSLFLPFAYHYLTVDNQSKKIMLLDCNGINVRTVKKIYFFFSLLGDGGFDFLINIFSVFSQMKRINKFCEHKKVFEIISKEYQM